MTTPSDSGAPGDGRPGGSDPGVYFDRLVRFAEAGRGVIGLALTGSRATGFERPDSDYDCALFVSDTSVSVADRPGDPPPGIDLRVFTQRSFAEHAAWGSDTAWDRYAWSIARFVVDRSGGELAAVAREKGRVPEGELDSHVDASLDWYLNQVARSTSCIRRGDADAGRLEAAESLRPFLQASFAIHDRRLVPYYGYLGWEIERRPLGKFDVAAAEFLAAVVALVREGTLAAQARVLEFAEPAFRREGYSRRFEEWETDRWREAWFPDENRMG